MEYIEIPKSTEERKIFLKKELQKFNGISKMCPAINKTVHIDSNSIKETINNASITWQSTRLALMLPELIENGRTLVNYDKPESNSQVKTFNFNRVYIIYSEIENLGIAKLVIGRTHYGKYIHYSVTAIKIYTAR